MAKRDKRRMSPRVDVRKLTKMVMENLPEFLLLKRRGGGITYAIDVDALPKMDAEKWNRMAMGNYGPIIIPENQKEKAGKFPWYENEEIIHTEGWIARYHKWLEEHPPMVYNPNEMIDRDKWNEMCEKLSKR